MKKAKAIKTSSPKMRVREIFEDMGIKYTDAEKLCGFTRGYLGTGGEMATDKLRSLKIQFPTIDLDYIIMGKSSRTTTKNGYKKQIRTIKDMAGYIDMLKEKNDNLLNSLLLDDKMSEMP